MDNIPVGELISFPFIGRGCFCLVFSRRLSRRQRLSNVSDTLKKDLLTHSLHVALVQMPLLQSQYMRLINLNNNNNNLQLDLLPRPALLEEEVD